MFSRVCICLRGDVSSDDHRVSLAGSGYVQGRSRVCLGEGVGMFTGG